MNANTESRTTTLLLLAACTFFVSAGQFFVPLLGIQNDEALFGYSFLEPLGGYAVQLGHARLPLMLMNYLGAFKAWVYRPIFAIFSPGVWSLREPAIMAGAASLALFFFLLRRIAGVRAALIGCALLATDALYLLTVCFDWGPVAFQHLLIIGGVLLLLRFYQQGGELPLAGGFFLLGLVMWDKALAIWCLGGMGVAAIALFPRAIWRVTTLRRAGIAVVAFGLGALPLIIYNAQTDLGTFQGNHYSADDLQGKARLLMNTGNGSALLGWLVAEDWQTPQQRAPGTLLQKTSAALSDSLGRPRKSLFVYAFALALLLAPLARPNERRAIAFAVITMVIQWFQMAITVDAGGSVHHSILLWPFPHMVVAVSLAAVSRRLGRAGTPVVAAGTAVIAISGVLVLNEYYRMGWQNGGAANWTDAVYPLSRYMKKLPAQRIYCVDWGIIDTLRLLNGGKLPLNFASDFIPKEEGEAPSEQLRAATGSINYVFIAHADGFEFTEGASARLVSAAEKLGRRRETLAIISDRNHRRTFEVYRFAPAGAAVTAAGSSPQ